ncbi:MAG: phosphoribosylformylglycinamidine synthase I [Candidatus Marinimicrobia bacterium]|nr:phosphoribosylformylglycinamidine synthase I [Candidatus Neomarinimicrobiota bacterium]|tara:strand:+ start:6810 stop:7481 length:672 start_codon:yes stop_codon:yes gene_type:complete
MRFGVIVFPGSNCDHDTYHVVKEVLECSVNFIWHKETNLKYYDCIVVPGGFSYGDYLRAGAIAKFSPIMKSVVNFAKEGGLVFGICNGFQVLVESGLLPGSLITNNKVKFLSKEVTLKVNSSSSIFTRKLVPGDLLKMPIAHKQGNYQIDADGLKKLMDNEQIAFTYHQIDGLSPNGSIANIAGVFNKNKNVLGMMPHPERAADKILRSQDGLRIFKSILSTV